MKWRSRAERVEFGMRNVKAQFIEHAVMPFHQALQMVIASEIRDAVTMLALLVEARLRNNRL